MEEAGKDTGSLRRAWSGHRSICLTSAARVNILMHHPADMAFLASGGMEEVAPVPTPCRHVRSLPGTSRQSLRPTEARPR